jgi:HAD superfamily hydrolase (TIGR01509 family)
MRTKELRIPPGDFAAYIFDLDGTLVDTMALHRRAWNEALRRAGIRRGLGVRFFHSLGGVPTRRFLDILRQRFGPRFHAGRILRQKEALFAARQARAKVIGPTVAFARRVAATHPVAVASGGPRKAVRRSLRLAGLSKLFPVVVTSDDVARGKPAPDMLLLAARRMKVRPEKCLVFEDAAPGIAAAKAVGMKWVRVPTMVRRRRAWVTSADSKPAPRSL